MTASDGLPNEWQRLREDRGYASQADWAIALDVSQPLVSKWERGSQKPSAKHIKLMGEAEPYKTPLQRIATLESELADLGQTVRSLARDMKKLVPKPPTG